MVSLDLQPAFPTPRTSYHPAQPLFTLREPFADFLQFALHAINALGVSFLGRHLSLDILKKRREVGNGGLEVVTGLGVMTVEQADLAATIVRFAGVGAALLAAIGDEAEHHERQDGPCVRE